MTDGYLEVTDSPTRAGDKILYKMRLLNQLKTLRDPIEVFLGYNLLSLAFLVYSDFPPRGGEGLWILNIIFCAIFIVVFFPRYLNYYLVSKNVQVTIDRGTEKVTVDVRGMRRMFSFNEIRDITRMVSATAGRRNNPAPQWGDFFYFDIDLKNGEEIIITSLMTYDGEIRIGDKKSESNPYGLAWVSLRGRRILNLELKRGVA
jgi:hypothetical protein